MRRVPIEARRPAHRFGLRTTRTAERLTIRVDGELVERSAHHLEEALHSLAAPHDEIQIDMTGITRVDEEGLKALRRSGHRADALNARITLSGLSPRFRRLLDHWESMPAFTYAEESGIAGSSFQRGSKRGQRE